MTVPVGGRLSEITGWLHRLQTAQPDIEASAVVSLDGLIIASALPEEAEQDRVSAMSAALLSLGERISLELGRGTLEQVFVRGVQGDILLMSVGQDAVLTAMTRKGATLGSVIYYMKRTAQQLSNLL